MKKYSANQERRIASLSDFFQINIDYLKELIENDPKFTAIKHYIEDHISIEKEELYLIKHHLKFH